MPQVAVILRWTFLAVAVAATVPLGHIASAQSRVSKDTLIEWGLEAYNLSVQELKVPGSSLFAETASLSGARSGGSVGYSFVWPASIQFRVLNALTELDPAGYSATQRAFSDELLARYWRSSRPGGYRSGVPASAEVFYDDNGHIVVALADAFAITKDPVYLDRARSAYRFVLSGEDDAGGGGIYFKENQFGSKDSISTLQAARAALMLHRATGENSYLQDATRLYTWTANTTQLADGRFMEKLYLTGERAGTLGDNAIVNAVGIGLSTNVEFFNATGEPAYIAEAQRIADISVRRYFDQTTFRINDEGYWAFELVDGLVDLYEIDGNRRWLAAVEQGLTWLHAHKRDPNGHYSLFWGRGGDQTEALQAWNLIDQAPVARAYLSLALAEPVLTGDFNRDDDVDGADFLLWQRQLGNIVVPGLVADANHDGRISVADYAAWASNFNGGQAAIDTIAVPEGTAFSLSCAALAFLRLAVSRNALRVPISLRSPG